MKVVHKFPVTQAWEQTFEVSEGAQVLDIELSDGQPCVWILLDPNAPKVPLTIFAAHTGQPLRHERGIYIKTLHVFNNLGQQIVTHFFSKPQVISPDWYFFYAEELGKDRLFHKDYNDGYYYELIDNKHVRVTDSQLGFDLVNTYTLKKYREE